MNVRATEDAILRRVERQAQLDRLMTALCTDYFTDNEIVSTLMFLSGHDTLTIARVLPRADRDDDGVTRSRAQQLINQALGKLAMRGFDTSPGMGGQGRRMGRSPLRRERTR